MSNHTSSDAAATSEQTRELRTDALDQIARGINPEHSDSPAYAT